MASRRKNKGAFAAVLYPVLFVYPVAGACGTRWRCRRERAAAPSAWPSGDRDRRGYRSASLTRTICRLWPSMQPGLWYVPPPGQTAWKC